MGRWALLGLGIGAAWWLGLLLAQFLPARDPTPPLQEVVTRRTSRFWQKVSSLPEWWAGEARLSSGSPETFTPSPTTPPPTPSPPITLSEAQREQITVELTAINADVQSLRDRTSALEKQLGLPTVDVSLEERLESAKNRLSPPTTSTPVSSTPVPPPTTVTPPVVDSLFQVNASRVTLPSDVLFPPGQSTLMPNAQPLLDSILADIARYPEATVVVGGYTDIEIANSTVADLSFQQALAVQRYLEQRLGTTGHRWLAVGYGNTTVASPGGTQLSRRITIAIVPQ
jgi:outer membrane protein OmpA-like peptidoglycan-associated protein